MSSKKKVLVTGGCGFIGSHVADALLNEGHEVCIIDDLSYGNIDNIGHIIHKVHFSHASILDIDELRKIAQGCECIFHLAAHTSVQRSIIEPLLSHEVNATGTLNVLECAKDIKARVVFSSTAAYYGDNPNLPLKEDYAPFPCSNYAAQKIIGEHYLSVYNQIYGLEGIVLRYFNVYGPRQNSIGGYSGVIKIFKENIENHESLTIFGDGQQTRDFVFVGDVAKANILAMDTSHKFAVMNIGTGKETDINTIARKTLELMKANNSIVHKSHRPGDPIKCYCDPQRAKDLMNFQAKTSLDVGMQLTLDPSEKIIAERL